MSFSAKLAKSKNHTTHNQSQKGHRNGVKKPQSQREESFKGVHPKFLRNFHTSQEVKPKIQKGISHKLHQLAYTTQSKVRKHAHTHIAKGLRLRQPKAQAKAQTKAQVEAVAPAPVLAPAPKGTHDVSSMEACVCH
ncbi:hypothetical protein GH733_010681, partial [Mirounga leonina]